MTDEIYGPLEREDDVDAWWCSGCPATDRSTGQTMPEHYLRTGHLPYDRWED